MDERTQKWLLDALNAANLIHEFTSSKTFDDYCSDQLLKSAIERQFEILGEALKRVRDHEREFFEQLSGAHEAVAFRNVLAHCYDSIEDTIVWNTIEEYLAPLRQGLADLTRSIS